MPYCGTPPQPTDLLLAWNLDPWLVLALALAALAFLSPLCALSSALFSVRIVHHVLLVSAIAPLLAAAFPAPRRPLAGTRLVLGVLAASATLWFWHAPAAYAAALADDRLYWLTEATLLGSAVFVWRELQAPAPRCAPLSAMSR